MRNIGEIVAVVGILLGLVFVGMEIRQNNALAQAAAYQEIGFQLADFHLSIGSDRDLNRLSYEALATGGSADWSLQDWQQLERIRLSALRIAETVLLQVEQGLLPSDAMDKLGGFATNTAEPAHVCLWPSLRESISPSLRTFIEENYPPQLDCVSTPALDSFMALYAPWASR